jgi:hypothetical protein
MVETTRWSNFEYSSMYSTMGIIFHLGLGYNIPPTRQMMLTLSTGHPNDVLVPLRFLATCLCLYLFAPPTFTHTYTCHQPLKFQFSAFDMTGCQLYKSGHFSLPWFIHHQAHTSYTQAGFIKYAIPSPQLDCFGGRLHQRSRSSQTRDILITNHLNTKHICNQKVLLDEHNDSTHAY